MQNQKGYAPVSHHDRPIIRRLLQRIIPAPPHIMRSTSQHRKFLVEILIDERDQGDWREEDVRDERGDDGREGGGDASGVSVQRMYVCIVDGSRGKRGRKGCKHQSHSDLEHVVAQRKVQKAVPRSLHAFAGVLAGVQEGFAAFVETGHRGRLWRWDKWWFWRWERVGFWCYDPESLKAVG